MAAAAAAAAGTGASAANVSVMDVNTFNSFSSYSFPYSESNITFPEGFSATALSRFIRTGYEDDAERNSRVLRLGTDASMLLPFNAGVTSGKLHISFDIKQIGNEAETSYNKMFRLLLNSNTTANYSMGYVNGTVSDSTYEYAWDDVTALPETGVSQFFYSGTEGLANPIRLYEGGCKWAAEAVGYAKDTYITPEQWHKVDIYLDRDTYYYTVFLDGREVVVYSYDETTGEYGSDPLDPYIAKESWYDGWLRLIKGIEFRISNGENLRGTGITGSVDANDNGGYLFDNIYVKHYTSTDEFDDEIAVTTDDMGGEGIALAGGRVNVAFSEYIDRPVTKDDVVVTNSADGTVVENYTIENSDNMQFVIAFDETPISAGQYNVAINNVVGSVTGNPVNAQGRFSTKAGVVIIDGEEIMIPWVDSLSYETYEGKSETAELGLTTNVNKIKVNFSAPVSPDAIEEKIKIIGGGEEIPYTCTMLNDSTVAELTLSKFLKQGTDYELTVSTEVTALKSDQVPLQNEFKGEFTTKQDAVFKVVDYSMRKINTTRTVRVTLNMLKNNDLKQQCTAMLVSYKNSETSGAKQIMALDYVPIEFAEDERSMMEYTISANYSGADEVKLFVFAYPTQQIMLSETLEL